MVRVILAVMLLQCCQRWPWWTLIRADAVKRKGRRLEIPPGDPDRKWVELEGSGIARGVGERLGEVLGFGSSKSTAMALKITPNVSGIDASSGIQSIWFPFANP
jgi:hypothetical protein